MADHSSFVRVESALADRVASRTGDGQLYARCPVTAGHAHGDASPSLSVTWKVDRNGGGRTMVNCQRGCDGADVLDAIGLTWSDLHDTPPARPADGRPRGSTARPSKARRTAPAPAAKSSPSAGASKRRPRRPEPDAEYVYVDAHGVRVFKVLRFTPTKEWTAKFTCATFTTDGTKVAAWKGPALNRRVLFRLPDVLAAIDAGRSVYYCEGEKDAELAAAYGLAATTNAFGACDSPDRAQRNWSPNYADALAGAHVVIVADNDRPGYRHALFVASELEAVAASIRVVRPAVDHPKADLHDHLTSGYAVEDLVEVSRAELEERAELDAVTASAGPAREVPAEDGEPAESDPPPNGDSGKLLRLFPDTNQGEAEPDRGGSGGGGDGGGGAGGGSEEDEEFYSRDRFVLNDDGIWQVKYRDNKRYFRELLDVPVRLAGRIATIQTEGETPELTHVDLIAERNGEVQELRNVNRQRWDAGSWVNELMWPASGDDTSQGRSMLKKALLKLAPDVRLTTAYALLGWRKLDGPNGPEWFYLHAGGALGANGPYGGVRVTPEAELTGYTLGTPPETVEELRAAVSASVAALDLLPARLAAPLAGAAYRACLGYSRATVMPVGKKGSGKTGLLAYAGQHYNPSLRYDRPMVGAGEDASTVNGLELVRHAAGDMLVPLDDLAPDRGVERASIRAAQIARSQYNRTGKVRMDRNGNQKPTKLPRSLAAVSGEETTTVESAESRTISLRVRRGDLDVVDAMPALDEGQEPERRAALTAAMVMFYAPHMPMTDWLDRIRRELAADLIDPDAGDPGVDKRHAESVADLAVGWRAMLRMATVRGALSEEEAGRLWERAWAGLAECKRHLMNGSATRTPADRLRELLWALLTRREVAILGKDDGTPAMPDRLGWEAERESHYEKDGETKKFTEWRYRCPVGWTDGERVWLQPGALFPAIARQARAEEEPLTYTKQGLGHALADCMDADGEPVIRTRMVRGSVTPSVAVRLGASNQVQSVWEFRYAWLFPEDADEETDPADPNEPGSDGAGDAAAPPLRPAPTPAAVRPAEAPQSAPATVGEAPTPAAAQESPVAAQKPQEAPRTPAVTTAPRPAASPSVGTARTAPASTADRAEKAQRAQEQKKRDALARYTAAAAVVERSGAWLAQPGQEPTWVEFSDALTLAGLLDWAAVTGLGHVDGHGRYIGARTAMGQVWLTTEARRALKLPASAATAATQRKVISQFEAAGWEVRAPKSGSGTGVSPWMRLRALEPRERADGEAIRPWLNLSVPEWLDSPSALREDETDAQGLARRIATYADLTGIVFQWSPATTGVQLAGVTRPRLFKRGPQRLPKPALEPNAESPYDETRAPIAEERSHQWVHLYDFNALYLGSARSLELPWGEYEHVTNPEVDLRRPGYWRLRQVPWEDARLLDPFQVHHRGMRETMWVTTPTLKAAIRLFDLDVEPVEAYLAAPRVADPYERSSGDGTMAGYPRMLESWARDLGAARSRTFTDAEVADDPVLRNAIKSTYAHSVGRFDKESLRGGSNPLWRPDWRHMIVANARYTVTNRIMQAVEADHRYPLGILTDAVLYSSDLADPVAAAPSSYSIGTSPGQVKVVGSAPMSEVLPFLDAGAAAMHVETDAGASGQVYLSHVLKHGSAAAALAAQDSEQGEGDE